MTGRQILGRDVLILLALTGWAAALPAYASEFVVSMALTCLMYVALSSSWSLFCGSTGYMSLATSAFFRRYPSTNGPFQSERAMTDLSSSSCGRDGSTR